MENLQIFLIEKVKQHEILYHKKLIDLVPDLKQEVWSEIGQSLNITADAAEKTWNYLKRCYISARTSEHESTLPWQFEKQMEFLIPHISSVDTESGPEGSRAGPDAEVVSEIEKRSKDRHGEGGSHKRSSSDEMSNYTVRVNKDDGNDICEITPLSEEPTVSGLAKKETKIPEKKGMRGIEDWVNQASGSKYEVGAESVKQEDEIIIEDFAWGKARDEAQKRRRDLEWRVKSRSPRPESSNERDSSKKWYDWRSVRSDNSRGSGGRSSLQKKKQKVALQKQMIDERLRQLKKQRRQLDRMTDADWDARSVGSSVVSGRKPESLPLVGDIPPPLAQGPPSVLSFEGNSVDWDASSVAESSVGDSVSTVENRFSQTRGSNKNSARPSERKHMVAHGQFDEEDIFYLSMARMCSKYSPEDQAMLKYKLTNYVLELQKMAEEEGSLDESSEEPESS